MKYFSLDLETTGLDPSQDQVLMISLVYEDSNNPLPIEELPHFTALIKHNRIMGNAFALQMNAWILKMIATKDTSKYPILSQAEAMALASDFITKHAGNDRVTIAGKNVAGFDIPFLPDLKHRFRHRCIDAGSVCLDWTKDVPPALGDLLGAEVTHDALDDARAVIRVLRRTYPNVAKDSEVMPLANSIAVKLGFILLATCLSGCGYVNRLYTHYTGDLTYKCSKSGVEYVQADSGLSLHVDPSGKPVTCK
ncbi:MAG: hypothetical protein KW793_04275 [Candidatus Doudnabacteria bacterium]|nr:hypothetical protein [Candidatus Doudnabacteria bacterium]